MVIFLVIEKLALIKEFYFIAHRTNATNIVNINKSFVFDYKDIIATITFTIGRRTISR